MFTGGRQTSATLFFFYLISFVVVKSPVIDDRDMFSLANQFKRRWRMETEVAGEKRLISLPLCQGDGGTKLSFSFAPLLALLLCSQLNPQQPAPVSSDAGFVPRSSDSSEIYIIEVRECCTAILSMDSWQLIWLTWGRKSAKLMDGFCLWITKWGAGGLFDWLWKQQVATFLERHSFTFLLRVGWYICGYLQPLA